MATVTSTDAIDQPVKSPARRVEPPRRRMARTALVCVMLLGAMVYAVDLWRPVDGRVRELWRESDVSGIARNFAREGMDIFYPRMDWRGDGPGYVEMEFPIYPYVIAVGYRVFGIHEQIGRVISYIATLVTLFFFLRLAAFVLPPPGAIVAGIFFAVNPLVVSLATAIQPEPFMLLGYVGAMYAWIRWLDDKRWWWYGWALGLTAFAILAKAPAAHIGIALLLLAVWRGGWGVFRLKRVWAFGALTLLPAVLWYAHARGFWTTYGNSLGVSNHHHFVGLAALTHWRYISGITRLEVTYVWTKAGVLAVLLGLALGSRAPAFWYGFLWYVAVCVYYLVIAGTSADQWAVYYHIVSVPPAALLIGWAAAEVWQRLRGLDVSERPRIALATAALLVGGTVIWLTMRDTDTRAIAAVVLVGGVAAALAWLPPRRPAPLLRRPLVVAALASATVAAVAASLARTVQQMDHHRWTAEYATARQFAALMAPGARIAVSGNLCVTPTESAYQQPWYLYWTDHKGFSPCIQDHSMALVQNYIDRGTRYFVVDEPARTRRPDFVAEMRRRFPVLAETPQAMLFQLNP